MNLKMLQSYSSWKMYTLLVLFVIIGTTVVRHQMFEQQTHNRLLKNALVICEARSDDKTLMVEQLKQEILTIQPFAWCRSINDSPIMLCKAYGTKVAEVNNE